MKLLKLDPRWVLLLCCLFMFLPFVNRPVYVDDHAHFMQAIERGQNPSHLYSEAERGLGWRRGEAPTEANPPVYFYLVGAFTRLAGTAEWKTHLLIFSLTYLGLLGFYFLAQRYTTYPLWTSLLWLTMPHTWLTANSLLLDSLLVPFMVGGLALFIFGWEKPSMPSLVAGSLLLGAAALVKYTGVLGAAAAVLWVVAEKKEWRSSRMLVFLIPVAMLGAWVLLTRTLYHESHFAATFNSSVVFPTVSQAYFLLVFLAGTAPVLLAPLLFSASTRLLMALLFAAFVLTGVSFFGGAPQLGVQVGAWAGIAAGWLFLVFKKLKKDPSFLFLAGWLVLGLAGLLFARGWFCARYFVVIGPAAALLTAQLLNESRRTRALILISSGVLSALLALGDLAQARVDKRLSIELNQDIFSEPSYYPSATLTGLSYYLDPQKWRALDAGAPVPMSGAVVLPLLTLPRRFYPEIPNPQVVKRWEFVSRWPLRTLGAYSGFYGSIWGPLPFAITLKPLDVFVYVAASDPAPKR